MTPQESKVAIIDDDRLSSHSWQILLKFISEEYEFFSSNNWSEYLKQNPEESAFFAVIFGKLKARNPDKALERLITDTHAWQAGMPVLAYCEDALFENLPEAGRSLTLRLPNASPDYRSVLRLLQDAREMQGIELNSRQQSKLISENGTPMFRTLVGDSEVMKKVRELMEQVATKNINVLILGESGTGKEIVARNIHFHSGRGDKAFIAVNCAGISPERFDTILFGQGGEAGKLQEADGGTIFLDKIDDMPLDIQGRLVQFLEHKRIEAQDGSESIQLDIRIVAASHKNLEEQIRRKEFREDLYYQLNVVPIEMPPLRKHTEDIPDLLKELMARLEHQEQQSIRFNSSAIASLKQHPWPGNVRELTNLVERLSIVNQNMIIGLGDLPLEYRHLSESETEAAMKEDAELETETETDEPVDEVEEVSAQEGELQAGLITMELLQLDPDRLEQYLTSFEKQLIEVAVHDSAGMLPFAAERLGLSEEEFQEKMKSHGMGVN